MLVTVTIRKSACIQQSTMGGGCGLSQCDGTAGDSTLLFFTEHRSVKNKLPLLSALATL
jgi:hypothetical protein